MVTSVVWLLVGGVLLYLGAEALIRGAVVLALRAGITPLVVGLTVVAAGTSMPELVVSVLSSSRGQGALALGNVIGSNICNILLIAGTTALIRPVTVHYDVVRREIPLMIGISGLTVIMLVWGGRLGRPEAAVLVLLLIASTVWSIRKTRTEVPEFGTGTPPRETAESAVKSVALVVIGLALLVVGADWFVGSAIDLARLLGISEALIGLTIVAIGTSLPELATSILAAVKGESDIALGNVVGSNIFNLLGILGAAGLVAPLALPADAPIDLVIMLGVAVLVLPLARSGFILHRWEGALLVGLYGGYIAWLVVR